MFHEWFIVHDGLAGAARLPSLVRPRHRLTVVELILLLTSGAVSAAAVGMLKLGLGIPGHAIVLAALPMAFGMSLAPRRLAGSLMSTGALGTAWLLTAGGFATYGSGAIVSLSFIGPMMDVAVRRVDKGWRVYAALILAGVVTNWLALASRSVAKVVGLDVAGARPFDSWWIQAAGTYTASGVLAGLLGALCWFHCRERHRRAPVT